MNQLAPGRGESGRAATDRMKMDRYGGESVNQRLSATYLPGLRRDLRHAGRLQVSPSHRPSQLHIHTLPCSAFPLHRLHQRQWQRQCASVTGDRIPRPLRGTLSSSVSSSRAVRQTHKAPCPWGVCTMTKSHFSYVQARTASFSLLFSGTTLLTLLASLTTRMLSFFILRGSRATAFLSAAGNAKALCGL